jgi:hypothetical protein
MNSILTVTAAASDLTLLTPTELRAAIGLDMEDTSQDTALGVLGTRVAARIVAACRVAAAGATPPTLRSETLSETFRLNGGTRTGKLILSRRPVTAIGSVVEGRGDGRLDRLRTFPGLSAALSPLK